MPGQADNRAMPIAIEPHALSPRHSMLVRAAITQVACGLIALMLWSLGSHDGLAVNAVYSFCIGNCNWLLIDGARGLIGRWRARRTGGHREWPGAAWMAPVVVVGAVVGYALGSRLAAAVLSRPSPSLMLAWPVLLVSLVAATVIVSFYYARERLHTQQLTAEAALRLAAETQLRLLQSQLEPHMLFNTLANLRVLIGVDAKRAQTMLDHLIAFLRTTLAASRVDRHRLAAEFDNVRDYLALMAVRMGPRLQVSLELPEALRPLQVPPMLLQPLVENAIKHGLEPKVEGGRIEVRAARIGTLLQLTVRDDGVGLEGGAAPPAPSGDAGTRFGLEQVRARLATVYGPQARLDLCAAAGGGTEAVLSLPATLDPTPVATDP